VIITYCTVRFDLVISLLSGSLIGRTGALCHHFNKVFMYVCSHAWAVQYQFCFHGAESENSVLESSINTVI